jgi:hypothetical protein
MAHTCDTCMYHVLSEHLYVPCLIWTRVCVMSYLNTCMCHVLSEHLYVPCLIWTLVCVMSYLWIRQNPTSCLTQCQTEKKRFRQLCVMFTKNSMMHDLVFVCAMSYLNTCMCHVLSEHLYVPCLIWTLVCQHAHRFFHLGVHVPLYLHFWGYIQIFGGAISNSSFGGTKKFNWVFR